ncbi:hypothetical protein LCGC14_1687860, partial [marine sediment metagenome]
MGDVPMGAETLADAEERMGKAVEALRRDLTTVRTGRASQGEYSLQLRQPSYRLRRDICKYRHVASYGKNRRADLWPYYGGMSEAFGNAGRRSLSTGGVFRQIFPSDWSGYDLLRFDVYCQGVEHTFRVALEDEDVEPPVVRNMTVRPGKWTTLEVDLRAAAKARGLDTKRMATMFIIVTGTKERKGIDARLDNLRLCRKGASAKFKVLRDDSPQTLPESWRRPSQPQAEKLPADKPDRSPLKLEKPFAIEVTDKKVLLGSMSSKKVFFCSVSPCGWAGAYDNNRLLVGFTAFGGRNAYVLQSLDGGKTWRGLDGGDRPTPLGIPNPDHGAGRGDVLGQRADVGLLANLGCAGTSTPAMRVYARKLTFTAAGWKLRKTPAVFDCDARHCTSNQSMLRLANGRLWCAHGIVGRLGTIGINLRYSDDDGLTWRSWRHGKSGALPGSFHRTSEGGVSFGYIYEEPCIVPFGGQIACLWYERLPGKRFGMGRLKWSRFDGSKWSAIEIIPLGDTVRGEYVSSRPPAHAVSVGGKEIFLVSTRFAGVLHYADGAWKKEAKGVPAGSRISVAGDRSIVVIAAVGQPKARDKGPTVIRSWQRSADGVWSGPVDLAREESPLLWDRHKRPAIVVQAYAPPNFVPVAWSCAPADKGKGIIRFLRVPVAQTPPR